MINMLLFLLFASLVACSLGAATLRQHRIDGRIQGGRPADIADFPYLVAMEDRGNQICGGSIISPDWVVTTVFCVSGLSASNVQFRAGSSIRESGGTLHPADEIIVHPQWGQAPYDFDVAVVRVSVPFQYGIGVQPISMASTTPTAGDSAVVSGWGMLSDGSFPSQLQAANLFVISRPECDYAWGYHGPITENMFCAFLPGGYTGPCVRDMGGPLVVGSQLAGLVSWGLCSLTYPVVYSNIATLKSWVTEQTGVQ